MSLWRRIFGGGRAPSPRLVELEQRVADVEHALTRIMARMDDALDALNARITNGLRRQKRQEDAGEAVEETQGSQDGRPLGRSPVASTAFLARRFRIGG